MAIQTDEYSDTQATKYDLIATTYTGNHSEIKGKAGEAYLNLQDNQWFFTLDKKRFFRVDGKNLSCNADKGWLKAEYIGSSGLLGLGKIGKAKFSEDDNTWIYKPKGAKEEFRVNEVSLKFIRDVDLTND